MTEIFNHFDLDTMSWILAITAALLTGMAKTGLSGAGLLIVPILAAVFGGRASTGILLPMLIVGDIFAVFYYNRHANWKYVLKLIPWAFAGIIIAVAVGNKINEEQFNLMIAVIVISGVVLLLLQDFVLNTNKIPDYGWFAAIMGLAGGFTTMIGNAAGPIMMIYLLSMRLPKNIYIGTGAWFFFIVNVSKVPFHVIFWKTINLHTLTFNLLMLIPIFIGAVSGFYIVKLFPEKAYRIFILATALASAFLII